MWRCCAAWVTPSPCFTGRHGLSAWGWGELAVQCRWAPAAVAMSHWLAWRILVGGTGAGGAVPLVSRSCRYVPLAGVVQSEGGGAPEDILLPDTVVEIGGQQRSDGRVGQAGARPRLGGGALGSWQPAGVRCEACRRGRHAAKERNNLLASAKRPSTPITALLWSSQL